MMGLKESLAKLSMINIKRGEVLFKEGVPSNGAMFFLFEGQLDIYKQIESKHIKVRSILPGEFFGEMAIINNSPRAASIVVVSEVAKLGVINRNSFVKMSQESPEFLFLLLKRVIERLYETESKIRNIKRASEEKIANPAELVMSEELSQEGEDLSMIPIETFTEDSTIPDV